ncbi:unnamed protein product [Cylicocyclus nassatus]|uniref:non-specific serine/threonine protein kinase n=1 Tax=Cylicocyclus nassatus TaxID=53992 RepID=A0AA36LZJ1_CYLNA|nr:unnamed protein product [Cylicocyclus nassatus]
MLPDGFLLSGDSALNGLPHLSKLVKELLGKKIKRIVEREAAKKDIGTIVSNCLPFYVTGSANDVYPLHLLIKDLCSLALIEVDENSQKLDKNTSSWKTQSLETAISVLSKTCHERILDDYDDLLLFIVNVVESSFAQSQRWIEDDLATLLVRFMSTSTSLISFDSLKALWSFIWRRIPLVLEMTMKSFGNYIRVARYILEDSCKCAMIMAGNGHECIVDVVEKLFSGIEKKLDSRWTAHAEPLLDLLSMLIDVWGVECREVLLHHCIPFAALLVENLDISASTSNRSEWNFFDRLFHLAIPDCRLCSLVSSDACSLAQSALNVLRNTLLSHSQSNEFQLRNDDIPLFSRLIVTVHTITSNSQNSLTATLNTYTQRAKRRREDNVLEMITEWNYVDGVDYSNRPHYVFSCLSLGCEITERWSHRIDMHHFVHMATRIWDLRSRIELEWQLSPYCQLLNNLIKLGAFDELCDLESDNGEDTAKDIWKFALSSAHTAGSFDTACSLIMSILQRFHGSLGTDDDLTEAVCDVLSRSASSHGSPLYALVIHILAELEFDELRAFPGVSDKRRGIECWKFRCQLAEWLITHSESDSTVAEPLSVICQLHPQKISSVLNSTEKSGIEQDLKRFGLSGSDLSEPIPSDVPLVLVPDLIRYISKLYEEYWLKNDLTPKMRVSLWCSFLMFLSKFEEPLHLNCDELISKMEQFIGNLIVNAELDLLSFVNLRGVRSHFISVEVLQLLSSRISDCPKLGIYLMTHQAKLSVSADTLRSLMRHVANDPSIREDLEVRAAAGDLLESFTTDVCTVPDLLVLLDESAQAIDEMSRYRLEEKISKIIEEDLSAEEYSIEEAQAYRNLLQEYMLKWSEAGCCDRLDLNSVSACSVIRYMESVPSSLIDWKLLSKLIEGAKNNVVLLSKVVKHVTDDPSLFHLCSSVLGAVLGIEGVVETLEQMIPDFALILDCHHTSIRLTQPRSKPVVYLKVDSSLRCDQLVESFLSGKEDSVTTEQITTTLLSHMNQQHEAFFARVFWNRLDSNTYALLTSFWKAAELCVRRKTQLLLLHNIQVLLDYRRSLMPSSEHEFQITLYSVISTMLHQAVRSQPKVLDQILRLVAELDSFSSAELLLLQYSVIGDVNDVSSAAKELFDLCVEDLCTRGTVSDIRVFHCAQFWRALRSALSSKVKQISESTKNNILSYALLMWDISSSSRRYVAPVLSLCMSPSLVPGRKLDCDQAVHVAYDYCRLVLSDPRLDSLDVFRSCLHILSCKAFRGRYLYFADEVEHKSHSVDDIISKWIVPLYNELLPSSENMNDFDSSDTGVEEQDPIGILLHTIGKHACCIPKLCLMMLPHELALHGTLPDKVIESVFDFAVVAIQSAGSSNSAKWLRIARCLAECIDGIGLYRLTRTKLDYQRYYDGMCALIKCCLLCDLPNHAFAVANVLYNTILCHRKMRHLAAFDGTAIDDARFSDLLKQIYIACESVSGLKTLPIEVQSDEMVRVQFSKARHDWLDVISSQKASLHDLMDAYYYCGINYNGDVRDLRYALAIRNNNWSTVSYPKKVLSHQERLFVFLHSLRHGSSTSNKLKAFLENIECQSIANEEIPNFSALNEFNDFSVMDLKCSLTADGLEALSSDRLILYLAYLLQPNVWDGKAESQRDLRNAMTELFNRLISIKAYTPCFSLLKKCCGSWVTVEKCRLLIAKGDENTAEHLLRSFLHSGANVEPETEIDARCLLAELLAGPKNMLDQAVVLLQDALDKFDKSNISSESRLRYFALLHRLTARQLSGIEEHMESRAFRMRKDAIREWSKQHEQASQRTPTLASRRIECELRCEKEVVETIEKKLVVAAVATVSAGLEALKLMSEPYKKQPHQPRHKSDAIYRHIFPLIDVIFRFDNNEDVVRELKMYVASGMVPAVWVQIVNHLVGHCFANSVLAPVIRTMVVKLIMAYPYHTLHSVLLYKFDENRAPVVENMLKEAERRLVDEAERVRFREVIDDMTVAHVAYLQFTAAKISDARLFKKRGDSAVYDMQENVSILRQAKILKRVPLPIVEQKICFPKDYSGDDLIKWESIERECIQADGISAPKVTRVKGSDGKSYKIIWKNDDVRQDCLVEQLFSIVNSILNNDEEEAFLRTYKVVPLDSKCGMIEFCQGTTSLKQILCGNNLLGGLHVSEQPQDDTPLKMRNKLKGLAKCHVKQASAVFREACAQFQPVFRHFFYREYPLVSDWTRMIRNYRQSLAQWSIVTYVVGLGDRHLSNVLFELGTCKLVHIDLGMILEYSKRTLPIPERVPFRLTRDLLDPLLIEGTDGRFAEECVHAMQLLRDNAHVILGLASVLLRETISNFEEVNPTNGDRPSFVAKTALARLRDKLKGTDDSFVQQDVQHQVRRLLSEATSVDNISRMFIGWMGFV